MTPQRSLLEQIAGRCVHFTGMFRNERCAAGVCYADVTVPLSRSLPCLRDQNTDGLAACAQQHFPSDEEARATEQRRRTKLDEFAKHAAAVRAHIVDTHGKWQRRMPGVQGTMPCPKCGGTLGYSRAAYNGHVWGKCATARCLSWME